MSRACKAATGIWARGKLPGPLRRRPSRPEASIPQTLILHLYHNSKHSRGNPRSEKGSLSLDHRRGRVCEAELTSPRSNSHPGPRLQGTFQAEKELSPFTDSIEINKITTRA